MRTRSLLFAAAAAAIALPAVAFPAAAGVAPIWGYAVVRDPTVSVATILSSKDSGNSSGGRVTARRTEEGSVTVVFASHMIEHANLIVTPLTSKPRACAVGSWGPEGVNFQVHVECSDRHGVPTDTPFVLTMRALRAGHGHVAYLWADAPGSAGYVPDTNSQMNGTGILANAVAKVDTGLWDARLVDLAASGGTVQVSSKAGTPARCGVVSWDPDGDDEIVRVRCRDLEGDPVNVQFTLWYAKGQGLASETDRKQAYLFAHKPKSASYHPKFRFTSENGASTVTRLGTGRYRVTLPNMAKGGAAVVTPVGDGAARCNVTSIRKNALPQRIGVRCFNTAGQLTNARFTLAYER